MHMQQWLILVCYAASASGQSVRLEQDIKIVKQWTDFIKEAKQEINYFRASRGDVISFDCSSLEYVQKKSQFTWKLMGRSLFDEGDGGHISIKERGSRITIYEMTELDSGVYTCYGETKKFMPVLIDVLGEVTINPNDKWLPIGIFVILVDEFRSYAITDDGVFKINAKQWLKPFVESIELLQLDPEEFHADWMLDDAPVGKCDNLADCELSTAGLESAEGVWRLELIYEPPISSFKHRRTIIEFRLDVHPSRSYLNQFPIDTHQYYMVYTSVCLGLLLMSLHLLINLAWMPIVSDVLPSDVSETAVLNESGVMLKHCRIKPPPAEPDSDDEEDA